jgi:UPF0716 protein FxsA
MLLLVLIFIVVPIAELYVIIQVGEAIGVLWTIALLLADSVLGSWLLRSQGRAVWRRFNAALAEGRAPTREVLDGVLVIFGGALLITPGFISDVFGAILLIPPTRALVRGGLTRRFAKRPPTVLRFGGRRAPGFGAGSSYDVEGSAHEVPPDPPRLP